jgi:hypothetical protein
MQEIEDKIEKLISESDNDESIWLEFLDNQREGAERLESRTPDKDPVLIGARTWRFDRQYFCKVTLSPPNLAGQPEKRQTNLEDVRRMDKELAMYQDEPDVEVTIRREKRPSHDGHS